MVLVLGRVDQLYRPLKSRDNGKQNRFCNCHKYQYFILSFEVAYSFFLVARIVKLVNAVIHSPIIGYSVIVVLSGTIAFVFLK